MFLFLLLFLLFLFLIFLLYINLESFPYRSISPLRIAPTGTASSSSPSTGTLPRYVLISGCDSGIGAEIALTLNGLGWHCIATCLTSEGCTELQQKAKSVDILHAVRCDITKPDDIDSLVTFITKLTTSSGSPVGCLYGLICNAGIMEGSFFDWSSMESFRRIMEVNFFGQVALIKGTLPLLIENAVQNGCAAASSRILTVVSATSLAPMPTTAGYNASKFAFEGLSASLRREFALFGVSVSTFNPGNISTALLSTMPQRARTAWMNAGKEVQDRYGEECAEWRLAQLKDALAISESPKKVVSSMLHALTSSYPKSRYTPGMIGKFMLFLSGLPSIVVDWLAYSMLSGKKPKVVVQAKSLKIN